MLNTFYCGQYFNSRLVFRTIFKYFESLIYWGVKHEESGVDYRNYGAGWVIFNGFLLNKGYEVHGIRRRASLFNTDRIDHLYTDPHADDTNLFLHYGDMTDSMSIVRIVQT